MSYSMNHFDDMDTIQAVQQNLQQVAQQLGQPDDTATIRQLYKSAQELVSHLSPDPLTLVRVAGVLLVYQLPDTEPDEVRWFKSELQNCPDVESIEELIDSLSRPDSL